eukprot:TRINITY_DN30209_c0_g1_i1.p3 TRINITY_DN30209_c0_g1~~TRINITY_DN30209_c0_g1_i1.p3  ORF type:complete len:107 (+),score=18.93 TRINITY_DN30209_c0_g1_i1:560-880(+)
MRKLLRTLKSVSQNTNSSDINKTIQKNQIKNQYEELAETFVKKQQEKSNELQKQPTNVEKLKDQLNNLPEKLSKLKELFGQNPILLQSFSSNNAKYLFRKIVHQIK